MLLSSRRRAGFCRADALPAPPATKAAPAHADTADTGDPGTIHHVGIYVGAGRMAEAPYTGARVRVSSIWRGDLIGATRPG